MAKVLVTGGAGYIGSHTVLELLDAGHRVVVVDNLSQGHRELVADEATFYEQDICQTDALAQILGNESIEVVMHFAGRIEVGLSILHPEVFYQQNVGGTASLLSAMRQTNTQTLIFSSTAAVYAPDSHPLAETANKMPASPYGASKWACEELIRSFCAATDARAACLRYFNAAGADPTGRSGELHQPETHLIPLAIEAALNPEGRLKIFGSDYPTDDGTCIRDFIHVSDLGRAHIAAMAYLLEGGKSIEVNVGTGVGHSVRQVCDLVQTVSGERLHVDEVEARAGDPAHLVADVVKAEKTLGWKAQRSDLRTIISDAVNFARTRKQPVS